MVLIFDMTSFFALKFLYSITLNNWNLEYGSSVWDPFRQYQIDAVEMVQRRAARFVTSQYNRYQSVTSMLQELKWTSLQQRRQEQ